MQRARDEHGVVVTTWVRIGDVLPAKSSDPLKAAVMLWAPAVAGAFWQVAWPVLVLTGWAPHPAITLVPSVNATVPPPGAGLTVAV